MLNQRVRRRHVATFGIGVDPRYHGKGVGSRLMQAMIDLCDNWAAIERIELTVFTDNPAAMALYRKFGFEIGAPAAPMPCATAYWSTPTIWRVCAPGSRTAMRNRPHPGPLRRPLCINRRTFYKRWPA